MQHDDMPGTDGPGLRPIFMCALCGTYFVRAKHHVTQWREFDTCPNPVCEAPDIEFDQAMEDAIWMEFLQIIGGSFNEVRRFNLRCIAEGEMGPFNPLYRNM